MTARQKVLALPLLSASLMSLSGIAEADKSMNALDSYTMITLGVYVKADAIWRDRSAGVDSVGDQQLNINLVPVGPVQHKKDQVTFHARQTRLSLGTSTPTSYGGMTTYIEGDFFGTAGNESVTNSNGFRIRHAYGTLRHFSAIQYWTNFLHH